MNHNDAYGDEEDLEDENDVKNNDDDEVGGISNLMGSLLGGGTPTVPDTLPLSFSGSVHF